MKNVKYSILKIGFIFLFTVFAVVPALASKKSSENESKSEESKYFVNFDEAEYRTSPDKRIGAKILVDPSSIGPTIASLINLTYLPGAHVASHRHMYSSEILYVLSGVLTVKVNGIVKNIMPNSSVFIPAGVYHEFLNDSADVVQFIQFFSPAAPEEEYRKWERPEPVVVDNNQKKSKVNDEPEEQEPQEVEQIVTPAMPTVPGSPKTRIGNVVTPQQTDVDELRERIKKALERAGQNSEE